MKTTIALFTLFGAIATEKTNAFIVANTPAHPEVPDYYANIQVDTNGANSNNNN